MLQRTTLIALTLTLGAGPAATAADAHWGEGPGWRAGDRLERVTVFLELSEEQVVQWGAVREEHSQVTRQLFDEVRALRHEVKTLLDSGALDPVRVGELVIAAYGKRTAIGEAREAVRGSLEELLTPDQLERLEALEAARDLGPRRGRGFGRQGPHGSGGLGRGFGSPPPLDGPEPHEPGPVP